MNAMDMDESKDWLVIFLVLVLRSHTHTRIDNKLSDCVGVLYVLDVDAGILLRIMLALK